MFIEIVQSKEKLLVSDSSQIKIWYTIRRVFKSDAFGEVQIKIFASIMILLFDKI